MDEEDFDIIGEIYGNISNANTLYGEAKLNGARGHGFAAERANHLNDLLHGKSAVLKGDDFVKNGADRIVDGVNIQSKYCNSGSKCISECFENGRFTIYEDGDYYIKYSKMVSSKMKLFNRRNECLCNIVLSEDLGIFLENNSTPYDLVVYEDFVGIYDRRYIDSLADTDIIDTDKLLADIEWDIIEKKF